MSLFAFVITSFEGNVLVGTKLHLYPYIFCHTHNQKGGTKAMSEQKQDEDIIVKLSRQLKEQTIEINVGKMTKNV